MNKETKNRKPKVIKTYQIKTFGCANVNLKINRF